MSTTAAHRRRTRATSKSNGRPAEIRVAIYTRKSTEKGLDQEFSTLDNQREAGEAYVRSQAVHGWIAIPERYDDGGFSGGTTKRPASSAARPPSARIGSKPDFSREELHQGRAYFRRHRPREYAPCGPGRARHHPNSGPRAARTAAAHGRITRNVGTRTGLALDLDGAAVRAHDP